MKRAIKEHRRDFIAGVGLVVVALAVSVYILSQERVRFPLISKPQYTIKAQFTTAKAVTAGQGQTVNISGVQVGQIADVKLQDGYAVLKLNIDTKYRRLIHQNATALLRPRTGLEDMLVELVPGSPPSPLAPSGFTIPLTDTQPTVESDEVLSSLNADSRAYLELLINGAGQGLKGQGGSELAQVYQRFLPTHRDLARLNQAVSQRGRDLQSLIHSLQVLNTALAQRQAQIVSLIDASAAVFHAFAVENTGITRAVRDLPGTLTQTTATLLKVQRFALALGPASNSLIPAAAAIPAANRATINLAVPATPILAQQIRPFVRAARPLVRNLAPASVNLANATPNLSASFDVLNHLFNMLGYCPQGGSSSCGDSGNGQHGYLWWAAWNDHNARTLFSQQDANGVFRPLFVQFGCPQIAAVVLQAAGLPSPLNELLGSIVGGPAAEAACKARGNPSPTNVTIPPLPPLPAPFARTKSSATRTAGGR